MFNACFCRIISQRQDFEQSGKRHMVRPSGSKNLTDEQVAAIIDAKVQGKTHPEIAAEMGLSLQVIHDRSVRHADDIAARKRELGGALAAVNAELWVTDKSERLALLQQVLEQYQAWFVDEEYDEDFRRRIGRDIGFITHQIDDLLGDLPTRAQLTVDMGNVELPALGTRWVQVPSDGENAA
jgi:hypothetical protein